VNVLSICNEVAFEIHDLSMRICKARLFSSVSWLWSAAMPDNTLDRRPAVVMTDIASYRYSQPFMASNMINEHGIKCSVVTYCIDCGMAVAGIIGVAGQGRRLLRTSYILGSAGSQSGLAMSPLWDSLSR